MHEETDWIYVVLWKNENLAAYLTKGAKLYVEGRIQTRSYDDNEGVKRYVTEVVADNIVLLGGNGNASVNGANREGKSRSRRGESKPANGHADHEFKTMTFLSKKGFPMALTSGRQERINDSPVLRVCDTHCGSAKACKRPSVLS